MDDTSIKNAFTLRAFLVGILGCAAIGFGAPYAINILHGSSMDLDFTTPAAVFLFFILTFVINTMLRAFKKNIHLTPPELILIYIMWIISSSLPTMGLMQQLLPIISTPAYYATAENRWADLIFPHLRDWIWVSDREAVRYFYEGLPEGKSIPWGAWLKPVFAWGVFILSFYWVMLCMMVMLRRQWVEKERLTYPLAVLPSKIVEGKDTVLKPFFRNKIMWLGFIIPCVVSSMIALHHYNPAFPRPVLFRHIPIFRDTTLIWFSLSFVMLGVSFLIPTNILLSLWAFNLISTVQQGVLRMTGAGLVEDVGIYGAAGDPTLFHQGMGALMMFLFITLWNARQHLRDVFDKAIGRNKNIDDSDEILSYPVAFWGMIAGLLIMGVWLYLAGLGILPMVVFLIFLFGIFIVLARAVNQSGLATTVAPGIPPSSTVSALGAEAIGPSGLTVLGLTYVFASDLRTILMVPIANGLKLATDWIKINRKKLLLAMALSIIITSGSAFFEIMRQSHRYGGGALSRWFFVAGPTVPYEYTRGRMLLLEDEKRLEQELKQAPPEEKERAQTLLQDARRRIGPSIGAYIVGSMGAVFMLFLFFMHQKFLWWPLHPVGYVLSMVWLTSILWFSIFLAWLIKSLALKYGGPKVYSNILPFFLGLIMGQFTINGVWLIIDFFTGMRGNAVFWI